MAKLKDFTIDAPRPLPVIVLADISGSMIEAGKIDALNEAVAGMLSTFAQESDPGARAAIHVAIITFGGDEARVHRPLGPATRADWTPLRAGGKTPLGAALGIATDLMEDRAVVPSRAYRPVLVLVSDGLPTDAWEPALTRLVGSPRASKAMRLALGVGTEADLAMLQTFVGDGGAPPLMAQEARGIVKFFNWMTMTIRQRSKSVNPDSVKLESVQAADLDF